MATIQVLGKYNFCYSYCLTCKITCYLEIITHPHNERSKIDSSVTLTCRSSISSSDVTFTWTHNGTIIRNHQAANSYTSRLTISNAQYSDTGSYVCAVAKGSLLVTSHTATITVYGKLNTIIINYHLVI